MECFHHQGEPAVGCCRACLKGVCRSCATELEGGLACSDRCEPMVRALFASIQQSARFQGVTTGLLRSARGLWLGLTLVALAVGLFVIVWGLSQPALREIAALGVPFLALAVISGRLARNVGVASKADAGAAGAGATTTRP